MQPAQLFIDKDTFWEVMDAMVASALSAAVLGMEVWPIHVEVDIGDGLPYFVMVGFPSAQVKEAQDRVRTALKNNGFGLPAARITVNFAPADIRKEGARYDLPLAAAILAASGFLPGSCLADVMILGELGLTGEVYATTGILPGVMKARELGCRFCIVPSQNLEEAMLVPEIRSYGVATIGEMAQCLREPEAFGRSRGTGKGNASGKEGKPPAALPDFLEIRGQKTARRAAEIAAGGFHNFLMVGPPGSGKTMIACRLPGILPELTYEERLKVTRVYSIAGLLSQEDPLVNERPDRKSVV